MGIRRLAGHLQPFSVSSVLRSNPDSNSINDDAEARDPSSNIVIDGPGLAYHIYYKILVSKSSSANAFDAQPGYTDVSEAFLAYLDVLETHGLVIKHIFFDGALPEHKRPVRISRLESFLRDLLKLHTLHSSGFPTSSSNRPQHNTCSPEILFNPSHPIPSTHRLLPALPFLIPAILDTLVKTDYASITSIVPGEADPFCARTARDEGGIILTGDSDLLVYDTGPQGSVAFFNQIELCPAKPEAGNPGSILRANIFHLPSIAARLNLPKLQRLAYEIKADPTVSFSEALRRARRECGDPLLLHEFMEEYALPPASHSLNPPIPPKPVSKFLLDPRLSELVHQLTSASLYSNSEEPQISLPFLIGDPSRSSAWEPSAHIRQFAYSFLINHLCLPSERPSSITEISRKGHRITSILILLPMPFTPHPQSHNPHTTPPPFPFLTLLSRTLTTFPTLAPTIRYRIFALALIYTHHVQNSSTPPSGTVLRRALAQDFGLVRRWEDVHLEAQIQGTVYGLRMLGQIISHLDQQSIELGDSEAIRGTLADLPDLVDGESKGPVMGTRECEEERLREDGVDVEGVVTFITNTGSTSQTESGISTVDPTTGFQGGENESTDFEYPKTKGKRAGRKQRREAGKGGESTLSRKEGRGNRYEVLRVGG